MTEAIEQSEEELYLQMKSDFVYFWCKEYGLPDIIALYLDRKLVTDGQSLLRLPRRGIDTNILSPGEFHLLRGALQQYAIHQSTVDDIINEKATEKRDEMLQRAQNALHGAKPEEKEIGRQLAEKILKCPSISQYIRERNRRKAKERQLQAQYDAQVEAQLPLAQRIMKRRQKMGIESRSISAPASNFEQYLPNDNEPSRSAKSTPARLRLPTLNNKREKSPKGRDTPSYADGRNTPSSNNNQHASSHNKLQNIMSRRNRVDSVNSIDTALPNEVIYKEDSDDENADADNNNKSLNYSKSRKKKKNKEDVNRSKEEATVTVICEIHERPSSQMLKARERSFTNPERMRSSSRLKKLSRNKSNE